MTMRLNTGRSQQKERTRAAIVAAARTAISSGGEVTMPDVARRAMVSEATAYRYFPDLASLLREVLAYQGAVRAMIAASITRPQLTTARPGRRLGLIDEALRPLAETMAVQQPAQFEQLKRSLAVVVSAEALFTLTDLCGLPPETAIASAAQTARSLTAAAVAGAGQP